MKTLVSDPVTLERRVAELEAENLGLTQRALGAEVRLAHAAQLYAAVAELHKTADTDEVVMVIKEIVANLVGCEEMGVYDVWPLGPICTYVDGIGVDANKLGSLPPTTPAVRRAIASRRVVVAGDVDGTVVDDLPISAVVPLVDGENVCGLVVLFRLLRQKPRLEAADVDLLEVLGVHAGRALIHVRLRERVR
jgi:hypothetical protein